MKGIDFSKWENGKIVTDVYGDLIALAYSNNYNVLNLLNKYEAESNGSVKHLFGSGSFKEYAEIEHRYAASDRIKYFNDLFEGINNSEDEIKENYFKTRKMFCLVYQSVYGSDKPFNECFEGYLLNDDRFMQDQRDLREENLPLEKAEMVYELVNFYQTYYNATIVYFVFHTLKGLSEALYNDFSESGYKTSSFQKPQKDIAMISKSEIDEIDAALSELIGLNKSNQKSQIKVTKKVYKKSLKQSYYQKYSPEYVAENKKLNHFKAEKSGLYFIKYFVDVLKQRYDYANEYYSVDKNRRIVDIFENIFSFGKRSPKLIDKVYYHSAEIFLLEQATRPFAKLNSLVKKLLERAKGENYHKQFGNPEDELKAEGLEPLENDVVFFADITFDKE